MRLRHSPCGKRIWVHLEPLSIWGAISRWGKERRKRGGRWEDNKRKGREKTGERPPAPRHEFHGYDVGSYDGTVPPSGVWNWMVAPRLPSLPWFNTRTPAVYCENGRRSSRAPVSCVAACRRRRRWSVHSLHIRHGLAGGPVRMSADLTSPGSSTRQYWICTN